MLRSGCYTRGFLVCLEIMGSQRACSYTCIYYISIRTVFLISFVSVQSFLRNLQIVVIILEQYHIYHWKSTRSQVLLKLYSIIGITKMYTITWTILKMFNITGTLSHVLVKCTIFPVLLIMYKSLVCYLLVCLWTDEMDSEKILTGLNDSGLTQ